MDRGGWRPFFCSKQWLGREEEGEGIGEDRERAGRGYVGDGTHNPQQVSISEEQWE